MVIAIILSGGCGSRLNSKIPKQYIEVDRIPILGYSMKTLSNCKKIDAIWIVADSDWQIKIEKEWMIYDSQNKVKGYSNPGLNRQLSIFNGMQDIINSGLLGKACTDKNYVLIHDAARPMIRDEDICNYVDSLEDYDGVMPVLPMKDTVYISEDGNSITKLIDRSKVYNGQAPEIFELSRYYEANKALIKYEGQSISKESDILNINGSSEVAFKYGMNIRIVSGNEGNFKITSGIDLEKFKSIILSKSQTITNE